MNTERTRELNDYLHLLMHLQNNTGVDCSSKIKQALNALHEAMGFVNVGAQSITSGIFNASKISTGLTLEEEREIVDKLNEIPLAPLHLPNKNPFDVFG